MSTLPNTNARILPDSIRQADGGKVTCTVATPTGPIQGTITPQFFEEFSMVGQKPLTPQHRLRIVTENLSYLEAQASQQVRRGYQEIIID